MEICAFAFIMAYIDLIRGTNGKIRKVDETEFLPRFNIIGNKIGRLFVKEFAYKKNRVYYYKCICDCGKECIKRSSYLLNNKLYPHKSCGCWHTEITVSRSIKHGMTKSATFKAWLEIKQRCYNPLNSSYKNYGERGITVCDRWLHSFENFLADMGERPTSKHSIDRIDVNGNYEPSNCRWATNKEQCNNRRNNVTIEYKGKQKH